MTASRTVEDLLERYPPGVQALAAEARRALRRWLPGVEEAADASALVIGYGYGPGYRGIVCTLILSKSGSSSVWPTGRPWPTLAACSRAAAGSTAAYRFARPRISASRA